MRHDNHTACTHCDALLSIADIPVGHTLICPRCAQTVATRPYNRVTNIALLISTLLLFIPAVTLPLLHMDISGQSYSISLFDSLTSQAPQGLTALFFTVFILVLVLPLINIVFLLAILLWPSRRQLSVHGISIFSGVLSVSQWGMLDVYVVAVIITMVKLSGVATLSFSIGLYCFIALVCMNSLVLIRLPHDHIWKIITKLHNNRENKA